MTLIANTNEGTASIWKRGKQRRGQPFKREEGGIPPRMFGDITGEVLPARGGRGGFLKEGRTRVHPFRGEGKREENHYRP